MIWDIPLEASPRRVRRCLHFYGKAKFLQWRTQGTKKAAVFEIKFKNRKRGNNLKEAWSIHFEEEKMLRVSEGIFEEGVLAERCKYKAIAENLPKSAIESILLTQLRQVQAKSVYILYNRNKYQRATASVYFASQEDMDEA